MSIARRIGEHRPKIICGVLVVFSVASLASGTRGGSVNEGLRTVVGVTSYPFLVVFNAIEGGYESVTGFVFDYGEMRTETVAMRADLTQLRRRVAADIEMRSENDRLRTMLAFQRNHPQFSLLPGEVLQHSRGVLTIDRGSVHGVREAMCVISPEGVIGLVTRTGPFTSSVATLQNPDCRVDAMIGWNRVRGRVNGTGSDLSALCTMHYIDLKAEVREGDTVVTSPDSVFPSGYPIGTVIDGPSRGQLSQSANIEPAADPFRVDEVFVLLGSSTPWRELAGDVPDAAWASENEDAFESATIQERLAP